MTSPETVVAGLDPVLREQVVEGICEVLPRVLRREVTGASEDSTLMEALGMTSTSALELILELEELMEREISIEDLGREHFATVGTLADYVAGNLLPEV